MADLPPSIPAPPPSAANGTPELSTLGRLSRITFSPRREEPFFLLLSIFIGIFSGLAVVCFRLAIDWTSLALLGPLPHSGALRLLGAPVVVGLVVAVLVRQVFPAIRGSGVNQTKAALYIYNGYIPLRSAVGKFICCALAIGSGQSLGPEDPSLQVGASIASALGRHLELSRERLRLLAPVGAAAGLAAAFNAPISAVLFVIEEVIGRWSAGILGAVVLAAVASVVIVRFFLGAEALFRIPVTAFVRPAELIAYTALGLVGGVACVLFAKGIGFLRPRLRALPRWTQYFQTAAAGLIIGLMGWLGAPQVMGAGYNFMDQAMHDQFTWKMLAILAVLKILATTLSFSTGTPGGMFAPTLFVGAMLGGAVGGVERLFFPTLMGSTGTYALVGMGVLFAGFLRAPMTSVFMVLETSGNYAIILPVIVANTVAYVVSRSLQKTPILDLLTRQDGLVLPSLEEQRDEAILRVEDAMKPPPTVMLDADISIAEAEQRSQSLPHNVVLVQMQLGGWRSVSKADLARMVKEGKGDLTLASVLPKQDLPYLYPDLSLDMALRHVNQVVLVPVVNRANLRKLEGVITRDDVLNRYESPDLMPEG
jgi:CIC family chloride channel protein